MSDTAAAHAHDTSGQHSPEEIQAHVRVYMRVFGALAILTVVTVAVWFVHMSNAPAITLALVIASVKASLVAAYFMHLIGERKIIFWVLLLTAIFFAVALAVPSFTDLEGGVHKRGV